MKAAEARSTMPDDTRIDRWLCAVRLVKTRPMATQLCDAGRASDVAEPDRLAVPDDLGAHELRAVLPQPIECLLDVVHVMFAVSRLARDRFSDRSAGRPTLSAQSAVEPTSLGGSDHG